ncbi:MAG: alanine--tRNA ligase, partial [Microgenomates group bacterium]
MHPLVPYLLGEPHPLGKRLCSVQKCLRTDDIDSVGDTYHHTFFEMLGNWSLGDYWKEEMIPWSFEFLTKVLNIPAERISVTCFAGDQDAPKDEETALWWQKVGIPRQRIYFLGKKDNWWGPAGQTGPCGPDTEMFYDTGKEKCGSSCRPGCSCGKYIEIWNDVFMQYEKRRTEDRGQKTDEEFEFVPLKQKNIDTGMGVERTLAVLNGLNDDYRTEIFWPVIKKIEELSGKDYEVEENKKPMRIIADHIRAAVFVIADGVTPSNTEQGYVLRRLIRRAVRFGKALGMEKRFASEVAEEVVKIMGETYPEVVTSNGKIEEELKEEEERFSQTLSRGIREFEKLIKDRGEKGKISGEGAFFLYETYGFPLELTVEMAKEKGLTVDEAEFRKAMEEHQQKSRAGAEKKFSGGLADHSEIVTKYHTATHLLHQALRDVLGEGVHQAGSNITAERLRFDFTYPDKPTKEQMERVEKIVNQKIAENLPVTVETMTLEQAKKKGALAFFEQKYGETVKVYSLGNYSN